MQLKMLNARGTCTSEIIGKSSANFQSHRVSLSVSAWPCACRAYARLSKYYDEAVCAADQEAATKRKDAAKEQQVFRISHQLRDTRREWDLNRPDAKLIDAPARIGDDDDRCGVSSLQAHSCTLAAVELEAPIAIMVNVMKHG